MKKNNYIIKNLLTKLEAQENKSLAPFTTLKVGGKAKYFVLVKTPADLSILIRALDEYGEQFHILGGGSNTLFSDHGFNGVVIKLAGQFNNVYQSSPCSMEVGAATSFAKVTKLCVELGFKSAPGWAGTPGVIGGAIFMNAGSKHGEIGDVIERVHGILNYTELVLERNNLSFSYRKTLLPHKFIITKAVLRADGEKLAKPKEVQEIYDELKTRRKMTQPSINSAGSFFKNPYPSFAGQLIESLGLKGLQYQGAEISSLHANFILNKGTATANDIIEVAKMARKAVYEHYGILLEPEILLVGEFPCLDPFMWK